MTPTREEFNDAFNRLHDKLDANKDQLTEKITDLKAELSSVKANLVNAKNPDRPCPFFKEHKTDFEKHINYHESRINDWKRPITVGIVTVVFLFITEPIRHLFSRFFGSP